MEGRTHNDWLGARQLFQTSLQTFGRLLQCYNPHPLNLREGRDFAGGAWFPEGGAECTWKKAKTHEEKKHLLDLQPTFQALLIQFKNYTVLMFKIPVLKRQRIRTNQLLMHNMLDSNQHQARTEVKDFWNRKARCVFLHTPQKLRWNLDTSTGSPLHGQQHFNSMFPLQVQHLSHEHLQKGTENP